MATFEEAQRALNAAQPQLRKVVNYRGSGVGFRQRGGVLTDEVCVVVYVSDKLATANALGAGAVPRTIDGVSTDVQESRPKSLDTVEPQAEDPNRYRPAPGGCSVGHFRITAGTLGAVLRRNGVLGILSNNHVLADSNGAALGDRILQPGPHDGGEFPIARLKEFVEIDFGGGGNGGGGSDFLSCILDCLLAGGDILGCLINCLLGGSADTPDEQALARSLMADIGPDGKLKLSQESRDLILKLKAQRAAALQEPEPNLVDAAWADAWDNDETLLKPEILEIGPVGEGTVRAELGMLVQKRGRTTRLQHGRVVAVNVEIDVQYGSGKIARFRDQDNVRHVSGGDFSAGGDSGSLIVTEGTNIPVSLLFAGGGPDTFGCPAEHVWNLLGPFETP